MFTVRMGYSVLCSKLEFIAKILQRWEVRIKTKGKNFQGPLCRVGKAQEQVPKGAGCGGHVGSV